MPFSVQLTRRELPGRGARPANSPSSQAWSPGPHAPRQPLPFSGLSRSGCGARGAVLIPSPAAEHWAVPAELLVMSASLQDVQTVTVEVALESDGGTGRGSDRERSKRNPVRGRNQNTALIN